VALLDINADINSNNGNTDTTNNTTNTNTNQTTDTTQTDDHSKVAALADGFANSAVNSTEVDSGATGLVGVGNSSNSNNSSSTDTSSQSNDNGNNRGNDYSYDTKVNTSTDNSSYNNQVTDTDTKVTTLTNTKDSYNDITSTKDSGNTSTKDSGNSYNYSDSSTHLKDSGNSLSETYNKDSGNYTSDSSTHQSTTSEYDFGTLKDIGEVSGNVGIAGGDLAFNLGDNYSFNLNLDNILNNSLSGDGTHTGFSLVQANNLADQDTAYNVSMNNANASNNLSSQGGDAHSDPGIGFDSKLSWDPSTPIAGHDLSGTSTANGSSILANSGYHQELVQGANMVSNTSDIAITGGDHHDTTTS
jgi:hypothetical protein